jgi:hypothetical protein
MISTIEERVISWLLTSERVGNSAKTIVRYFLQAGNDVYFHADSMFPDGISKVATPAVPICPSDFDDFERCYKLLEIIPEWKIKFHNIAKLSPQWKILTDNWDALVKRYLEQKKYGFLENYEYFRSFFDGQCLLCVHARNPIYDPKIRSTILECWVNKREAVAVETVGKCEKYSRKTGE